MPVDNKLVTIFAKRKREGENKKKKNVPFPSGEDDYITRCLHYRRDHYFV